MIEEQEQYDQVAQAFSLKASVYDEFGRDHRSLERTRHKVYSHVLRHIQPGARILEINAGTGADAAYYARQGFSVTATDISPGMVAAIEAKIEQHGLAGRLAAQRSSFTDLSGVQGGPFDYLISNLGGLNCIADLSGVARQLPSLLKPGGRLTWVIMPPICPWELALAFKGDFRTAFRRLHRRGIQANVEGIKFQVRYFTPGRVRQALGCDFRILEIEGLSVFTPPADHKGFALRFPALYSLLVKIDDFSAHLPLLRGCGDFYIFSAEFRP